MRKLKKALVLCMCALSLCTVALAKIGDDMKMNTNAVVLSADDFQKETSQKEPKTSVSEITRQTDMIGTAEHPTIEGGLMSAPELQTLSEEKDFVSDERTMLILAKLNEILDRSPAYNAKALLAVGQKVSKTALKKLRMQTRLVFRFWMKKALIDANASINPKQKSVHKAGNHAHLKSFKKNHHGVKNASH